MRARLVRAAAGVRQHAGDRRALRRPARRGARPDAARSRSRPARPRSPGSSPRSSAGWPGGSPAASPTGTASRRRTRWASSARWASPATSSSSPTCAARASENGIRVGPGRGSAAGAVIAYALGITELDPLEHGLLFERFLNPERVSMPDIDLDFDERRRAEMIRYATAEVRRGAGRPDHHVRHDQGEGRDQGRRAGARLPVRARRPDHQGDAAAGDGQGHLARRHLRDGHTAVSPRPGSSARSTTPTPT